MHVWYCALFYSYFNSEELFNERIIAMNQEKKKVEYLIVDTSAFIKNAPLHEIAENLLTVPEVVKEIKNKRQLKRLAVLPYDLVVKDTFPEHVAFVTEFSKKTGDYPCLSAADIQVIALTYQLEKEKVGTDHLCKVPVQTRPVIEPKKLPPDVKNIAGFYLPRKKRDICNSDDNEISIENSNYEDVKEDNDDETESGESVYDSAEDGEFDPEENLVSDNVQDEILKEVESNKNSHDSGNSEDGGDGNGEEDEDDDEDDDDSGWITPSNIKDIKNTMSQDVVEDAEGTVVACLTTDFAMQNVLKQMGLKVVTLDGKLIKQLRTFILRCYGCFKTTSVMTNVFCPNCGNKTLKRVAVSLNPDGTQKLHINFRRPLTSRGKKYSLPTFKGGKHSSNPVLSADQSVPQQRMSKMARQKNNPLDDDFIAGFSPFVTRDVTSKSAMLGLRPQTETKYWMRRNPNEARPNRKKNKK